MEIVNMSTAAKNTSFVLHIFTDIIAHVSVNINVERDVSIVLHICVNIYGYYILYKYYYAQ
jgi:hypothetical protein